LAREWGTPVTGTIRTILRWLLTLFMVVAGANHFVAPAAYLGMMPSFLPAPAALVAISGVAEILGGLGLILPATRRLAGWGLIGLFVAIFPANINMAVHHLPLGGRPIPSWALWARLPLQAVLVVWAYWCVQPNKSSARVPDRSGIFVSSSD
jgi:uncharacterized membrane protein